MGTLYQLTSPIGKCYIGISSKTTEARWSKHIEHALGKRDAGALYSAIRKYGIDSFSVRTLVVSDDWGYLCDLEKRAIAAFNCKSPNGYNITDGGEGTVGRVVSDEERKNISFGQKRRFQRPEERDRLSKNASVEGAVRQIIAHGNDGWMKGKTANTFTSRLNRSLATREGMSKPEVKQKMSDAAKKRLERPGEADRLKGLNVGRKHNITPEWAERKRAGIIAAWADPEKKAARIEKNRITKQKRLSAKSQQEHQE